MSGNGWKMFLPAILCSLYCASAFGQSTAFTYQGRLTDGSSAANGNYDLQFTLWDAGSGGNQLPTGSPITVVKSAQPVASGVFTVSLDFGGNVFTGADRFLEISVRHNSNEAFAQLLPRQPISSTPYAVRSLKAATADNVAVNGVPAGSGNYIQNSTSQQASSNFNISGNGTLGGSLDASVVNAAGQYNLHGNLVLNNDGNIYNLSVGFGAGPISSGSDNVFVGNNAGKANTAGHRNSFLGRDSGGNNSAGSDNAFFGAYAGSTNAGGSANAFFGAGSGLANAGGSFNSFFGSGALDTVGTGLNNTSGSFNSFFGHRAGEANVNGDSNSYFGTGAGLNSVSGSNNTFIGHDAGDTNASGSFNTIVGAEADVSVGGLTNATAIGYRASVNQSNSIVLGSISGINGCNNAGNCADTKVGIGTTTPNARLQITDDSGNILLGAGGGCNAGYVGISFASTLTCTNYSILGEGTNTFINRPTGGAIFFRENNADQMVIMPGGAVQINTLGPGGTTLCRNNSNQISNCSSSLRYKTNIHPFGSGLNLIARLSPITFNWKQDGTKDLGLGAEDVAKIEPLLITYNGKGEVEGVKYDRVAVVLINAVKEQQKQIEELKKQVRQLQATTKRHNPHR